MIVFRLDSSRLIGSGHLMRCLTLAREFERAGITSLFVCRSQPGEFTARLESDGFRVVRLPAGRPTEKDWLGVSQAQDSADTLAALRDVGAVPQAWVVDHYFLGAPFESVVRAGRPLLAIDDIADRQHDCSALLDQNYSRHHAERYAPHLPSGAVRLFGPTYALLRPEFVERRRLGVRTRAALKRVLITFGGVDLPNGTLRALEALERARGPGVRAEVLSPPGAPHRAAIDRFALRRPWVTLHHHVSKVSELMDACDLCIGATGATTWERLCLGLPTLSFSIAENQVAASEELVADGFITYLGRLEGHSPASFSEAIRHAAAHLDELWEQGRRGMRLVDGLGASRVAAAVSRELEPAH